MSYYLDEIPLLYTCTCKSHFEYLELIICSSLRGVAKISIIEEIAILMDGSNQIENMKIFV